MTITHTQEERIEELQALRDIAGIPKPIKLGEVKTHKQARRKVSRQNASDAYLIDRMHSRNLLTDEQWYAGTHIRFWHDAVMNSPLRSRSLDTILGDGDHDPEAFNINKLNATDYLMKTMRAMQEHEQKSGYWSWQFCYWLCIDEKSFKDIAKLRRMRETAAASATRDALDVLHAILYEKNYLWNQRESV